MDHHLHRINAENQLSRENDSASLGGSLVDDFDFHSEVQAAINGLRERDFEEIDTDDEDNGESRRGDTRAPLVSSKGAKGLIRNMKTLVLAVKLRSAH